jgi:hypothetical protein
LGIKADKALIIEAAEEDGRGSAARLHQRLAFLLSPPPNGATIGYSVATHRSYYDWFDNRDGCLR